MKLRDVVVLVKIGRPAGAALVECGGTTREFAFGSDEEGSAGRSLAATDELILTLGADCGVGRRARIGRKRIELVGLACRD